MCMINSHSSAVFLRLSNSTRLFPASASRHRAPPFSNCTIVLLQQLVDSVTCLPFDIYNFPSITTRTTNCNEWSALCNNFCSANIKTSIKIMIFRYFQQFSFFFPFPLPNPNTTSRLYIDFPARMLSASSTGRIYGEQLVERLFDCSLLIKTTSVLNKS